jgi:hypothetical protein
MVGTSASTAAIRNIHGEGVLRQEFSRIFSTSTKYKMPLRYRGEFWYDLHSPQSGRVEQSIHLKTYSLSCELATTTGQKGTAYPLKFTKSQSTRRTLKLEAMTDYSTAAFDDLRQSHRKASVDTRARHTQFCTTV